MDTEEVEEVQAKGIRNLKKKIENFLNIEEEMPTQLQEASRSVNRYKIEHLHGTFLYLSFLILKMGVTVLSKAM
jgi:hypothetical protein